MAKKKKHGIRELLSMLPEAGVSAHEYGRGLFLMLPSGALLHSDVYTDRLALACYCREVARRIAGEYGKMCDDDSFDDLFYQSYRAMHGLGYNFMEWAEQCAKGLDEIACSKKGKVTT